MKRAIWLKYVLLAMTIMLAACTAKINDKVNSVDTSSEMATDLLLRAHRMDFQAMSFVVAGYMLGINGFPQDDNLALAWLGNYPFLTSAYDFNFLWAIWLQAHQEMPKDDGYVRTCLSGSRSNLAEPFRMAGVFDIQAYCEDLARTFGPLEPLDMYEEQASTRIEKDLAVSWGRVRDMAGHPGFSQKVFDEKNREFHFHQNAFWALMATTHDPRFEKPQWKPERLIAFLESNFSQAKDSPLKEDIDHYLINQISLDPLFSKMLILQAHAGDVMAMREMAATYENGSRGFTQNSLVATSWINRAAIHGDAASMLVLSFLEYRPGVYSPSSRTFALLAWMFGEGETRESAKNMLQLVEKNMSPEDRAEKPWMLEEYLQEIQRNTGKVPLSVSGF